MPTDKEIMIIDEVAEYLQFSKVSVHKLAKAGKIPCKKVLNMSRFVRDDIKEWVSGR